MKTIINDIAQKSPDLTQADFLTKYRKAHPLGEGLNADHLRQAFETYKKAVRKRKRTFAGKPGTVGPDRIPR